MTDDIETWIISIVREIKKHADRDGCYSCKQILKTPKARTILQLEEDLKKL